MIDGIKRRDILKTGAAGFAATSLTGCLGGDGGGSEEGTLHLGVLNPLAGPYGFLGKRQGEGVEMMVNEANRSDDLLPDTEVTITAEDTETDPEVGRSAARNLVESENVDALVGTTSSSVAGAVSDFADGRDIPFFIALSSAESLTTGEDCRQLTFRGNTHTMQTAGIAGRWATDKLGEKVYLLHQDYSYGYGVRDGATAGIEKAGGEVVGKASLPLGAQEFGSVIDDILSTDPDWVHMGMSGSGGATFFAQASNRGVTLPMSAQFISSLTSGQLTADEFEGLGPMYRGAVRYTREIDTPESQDFGERYQEEFGRPVTYANETGYLTAQLAIRTFEEMISQGQEATRQNIMGAGRSVKFDAPRGEIDIRDCDNQGSPPLRSARVTGVDTEEGLGEHEILAEHDSTEFLRSCDDMPCDM